MISRAIDFFRREAEESPFWTLLGPISLLCTVALAAKTAIPSDLLLIGLIGTYLSAHWGQRGCVYALVLLGAGSAIRHCFLSSDHLWNLGLEGSLACAFFITALAFEQGAAFIESLNTQIDTRSASLQNLEEELEKTRQQATEQQVSFQEKIIVLQKELEEIQTDHSSLLILNEVLRKTTARHREENEAFSQTNLDNERQIGLLQLEIDGTKKELQRLSNAEGLIAENRQLTKELNGARLEREQTHLINETLVRLHAKESLKAAEASQQVHHWNEEKRKLQELIAIARGEQEMLSGRLEQAMTEREKMRNSLLQLDEVQTQRTFLHERLQAAEVEMAHLQQKATHSAECAELQEQLQFAQEKITSLAQIEPLYLQLKKQFEEKNQLLHQTRSQLFKIDTELQAVRLEREQIDLLPEEEIVALEQEITTVEEENRQLYELIAVLNESVASKTGSFFEVMYPRKKKVKTKSEDVPLLF